MKNSLLIRLLIAALFTGAAHAAIPIDGWYTSVFGGYTFVPDNFEILAPGLHVNKSSFNSGYNVGGRVGYQSNPLRYEGEYTHMSVGARSFRINNIRQFGVSGYSTANIIMANVYYDTPEMLPALAPFLGIGIGYANVQETFNGTAPVLFSHFSASENSFAYQGTLGLTFNYSEIYTFNLAYRYIATSSSGNLGHIFQAHNAAIGIIYHFDNGEYK